MSRAIKIVCLAAALGAVLLCGNAMLPPTRGTDAGNRTFAMGFTPFPYDATVEAWSNTFDLLIPHSDMITHHFDGGVPWQAALDGTPYLPSIIGELQFRKAKTPDSHKIYLAVSPISNLRDDLAGDWADLANQPRQGLWATRTFTDLTVKTAFLNHCRFMIEYFQPDYFAYAIEVDILFDKHPDRYANFLKLARVTYRTLKKEYPDLPIFLTITTAGLRPEFELRRKAMLKALRYSDFVAISTYPYLTMNSDGNPKFIEPDLFTRMAELAPDKPFAIAETGYPAEALELPTFGISILGKAVWQKKYVSLLLAQAQNLHAAFVTWFCFVDFDKFWELMQSQGASELNKAWKDTGLYSEALEPRPALRVWDAWLSRELREK